MKTGLMEKLQMETPIIQAPMAGVSTPQLAAAVSNAGGLGSISVGAMTVETARQAIEATKQLTERSFNVNVFCHESLPLDLTVNANWLALLAPLFAKLDAQPPAQLREIYQSFNDNQPMLDLLLSQHPAVVSFHFGLPPQSMIDALRQAGITLIASATCLQEAKLIESAGLDAVIAQGIEAGGHRGVFDLDSEDERLGILVLTRQLVREVKIPVIAAGGLMDGAGIRVVMDLGTEAAQLGTAFVACPESAADDGYRAALLSQFANHTILTQAISGRPARGFPNALTEFVAHQDAKAPGYPYAYDAAKALQSAAKVSGVSGFDTRWAGQGASLARALPASELMLQLRAEMAE